MKAQIKDTGDVERFVSTENMRPEHPLRAALGRDYVRETMARQFFAGVATNDPELLIRRARVRLKWRLDRG